jgi:hypothetical protein
MMLLGVAWAGPVEEAVRLREEGDLAGATVLLAASEALIPADGRGAWLYQRGVCEELAWRWSSAEGLYRQAVAEGGDTGLDARLRLVLVLEHQDRHADALSELRPLYHVKGLLPQDRTRLDIQRGALLVAKGRSRGPRVVLAAMEAGDAEATGAWWYAKGRASLVRALLDEADGLALTGSERRVVRHLELRARGIKSAEAQITALAGTEEPEWIVDALVRLGDSYAALGRDVAGSPPPGRLSEAEAAIYREEVGKKAENARTKAWHWYDQAVALATRLTFASPRVEEARERREAFGGER